MTHLLETECPTCGIGEFIDRPAAAPRNAAMRIRECEQCNPDPQRREHFLKLSERTTIDGFTAEQRQLPARSNMRQRAILVAVCLMTIIVTSIVQGFVR